MIDPHKTEALDVERVERLIEDMAHAFEIDDNDAFRDASTCLTAELHKAKRVEIQNKGVEI